MDQLDLPGSGSGSGRSVGIQAPADPVDRLEHPPGRVISATWFPAPKIAVGFGQEGSDAAGVGDGRPVLGSSPR